MSTPGQSASHPGYPFSNSPSQGVGRPGNELLNQGGSNFGPRLVHRPLLHGVPGNLPGDSDVSWFCSTGPTTYWLSQVASGA